MSRTVPLMLQLSAADPRPITRQIADGIRRAIATVNPNTIAKAYGELANDGWLDSRQGLGLFVATPRQRLSESERERRLALAIDTFAAEVVGLDYATGTILQRLEAELAPMLDKRSA